MITIYYAHCMALYDTAQEVRDVQALEALGFTVCNPNTWEHKARVAEMKSAGADDVMPYFCNLVASCGALAFRALPDGSIPSGVAKEIDAARECILPVIELPNAVERRTLSVAATREYLRDVGQR